MALRRQRKQLSASERAMVLQLRDLIVDGDAILLGSVRQELLTGISDPGTFEMVRRRLEGFENLTPEIADYERGAEYANQCTRVGIATTTTDMLICAVAAARDLPILTTDGDFIHYARKLPIQLYPNS
jgi:predicted nucleic acid-binding protein